MRPHRACHRLVRSSRLVLAVAMLVALALVAVPVRMAQAASIITVNDASGGTGGPGCKLRDAITAANTDAPTGGCPAGFNDDIIVLPAGATITLTVVDNGSGAEMNGLPAITTNITVYGNNAIIERSGAGGTPNFRIIVVYPSGSLVLHNLTLRNGKTSLDASGYSGYGGAIENVGHLYVIDSTISGNSTGNATGTASSGWGGGINGEFGGLTSVMNSTLSGNSTGSVVSGPAGNGGGINVNAAPLYVTNSTISGNTASGPAGVGGGININPNTTSITSSTITGNSAANGGGLYNRFTTPALPVTMRNTIVAMNTALANANCFGPITNGGNNIASDTSCGWSSTNGSMSGTNPQLGALANNGGSTRTHALLPGSPAIDGVTFTPPNGSPSTDQRGTHRPQGARYDIGAFELVKPLFLPLILRNY